MNGQFAAPLAGAILVLAACGGGSGGGSSAPDPARSLSQLHPADPANDSGTTEVQASVARVYANAPGQIRMEMVEGPMAGMVVLCEDRSGASCQVNAARGGATGSGALVARRKGNFSYVGMFSVDHLNNGVEYSNTHVVHDAEPTMGETRVTLPSGVVRYDGQFVAGAGVGDRNGMATGTATILANFDSGAISGELAGALNDAEGAPVHAVFNGLELDSRARTFASTPESRIRFQDMRAQGQIEGGFYGPSAQEAAGVFSFGNGAGGMTGVFLSCKDGVACIRPE